MIPPKESHVVVQRGGIGVGRGGLDGGDGGRSNLVVVTKNGTTYSHQSFQSSSSSTKSSTTRFSIMMMPSFIIVMALVIIWYQNIVHLDRITTTMSILQHTMDVDRFLTATTKQQQRHNDDDSTNNTNNKHKQRYYNLPIKKKYAIYMTTHMSTEHIEFLTNCWPTAIQTLPLLRHADFIVYASGNNTNNQHDRILQQVLNSGSTNSTSSSRSKVRIYRHVQKSIRQYGPKWRTNVKKQDGAVKAMVDPFLTTKETSWFDGYDWIVRLNPDVLIRDDTWLLRIMEDNSNNTNNTVDAIVIPFTSKKFTNALHSDFFAFRPHAINGTALIEMYQQQKQDDTRHAESHVYVGFQHLIQQGRVITLPNASHRKYHARTTGPDCDIVHDHKMLQYCPNYFDSHPT